MALSAHGNPGGGNTVAHAPTARPRQPVVDGHADHPAANALVAGSGNCAAASLYGGAHGGGSAVADGSVAKIGAIGAAGGHYTVAIEFDVLLVIGAGNVLPSVQG